MQLGLKRAARLLVVDLLVVYGILSAMIKGQILVCCQTRS